MINIVLRGHVRNAFDNCNLNDLITNLRKHHEINIYINTWSDIECKRTWRHPGSLVKSKTIITKELIYNYFKNNNDIIKIIQIQNEEDNLLIGDLNGFKETNGGLSTKCWMPKKGWKFFIYNAYEALKLIPDDHKNNITICMRLDMVGSERLFATWHGFNKQDLSNSLLLIINKYISSCNLTLNYNKIRSIGGSGIGYDNALIGSSNYLYNLFEILHYNLDAILTRYTKWCPRQENIPRNISEILVSNNNIFSLNLV